MKKTYNVPFTEVNQINTREFLMLVAPSAQGSADPSGGDPLDPNAVF